MVAANITPPTGFTAYWNVILALDEVGPWTVKAVDGRLNAKRNGIKSFVARLVQAGIAEIVDSAPVSGRGFPRTRYRLVHRPAQVPRIGRDGKEAPEAAAETVWRTMKMTKSFTSVELAEMVDGINRNTIGEYLRWLALVGVVAEAGREPGKNGAVRYILVENIGSRAPKILRARLVFDPNSNVILGEIDTAEVQP